jgi:hypothetical protein
LPYNPLALKFHRFRRIESNDRAERREKKCQPLIDKVALHPFSEEHCYLL